MYDLEQQIMNCWQVVDDLKDIYHCERLYDDENEMQNALIGMFTLYQIKFEKLFDTYEQLLRDKHVNERSQSEPETE